MTRSSVSWPILRVTASGPPIIAAVRGRRGRFAVGRDASRAEWLEATWVDLVEIGPEDRVLLVDPGHRRAETALRSRTSRVTTRTRGGIALTSPPPGEPGWDVVCVDDLRLRREEWRDLLAGLAPHGRAVQVCDNALSPLRLWDLGSGRAHGAVSARGVRALVRPWGEDLVVDQVFGLLRSSMSPLTAFDLRSATGVATTVAMSLTHVGGLRGATLRLVARAHPALASRLVPAWLVVGARPPRPDRGVGGQTGTARPRIVGKIGNRDSSEIKIVRGDPPAEVERHSVVPPRRAEIRALRELEDAGFGYSPRVLEVAATWVRYTWVEGEPLVPADLDDAEMVAWTARAVRVLASLQELSRRPDGSVLVHGDFWLGNLLVRGEEIVGLIDWHDARRGSPHVDRRFLPVSYRRFHASDRALLDRLEAECAKVLPLAAAPDPALCLLGDGDVAARPGVAMVRYDAPEPGAGAEGLGPVLAWAARQPATPVLLVTSRAAALAVAEHRAVLGDAVRVTAPAPDVVRTVTESPALAEALRGHDIPAGWDTPPAHGDRPALSYHAYADEEGDVVAHFGLRHGVGSGAVEVTADPEVLAFGRVVVEALSLPGPVSLDLATDDRGGLRVLAVEPWLGADHAAGLAHGVDIAGFCYADLAGLPRPPGRSPDHRAQAGSSATGSSATGSSDTGSSDTGSGTASS